MSFNCAEQRKKDLMQLVGRVVPVAPLLKGIKERQIEIDEIDQQMEELEARREALESENQAGDHEVNEYLGYAGSLGFCDEELLRELLGRAIQPDCSDDEFYTIIIVILSNSFFEVPIEEILEEYAEQVENANRKFVLQSLGIYQPDDICNMMTNEAND